MHTRVARFDSSYPTDVWGLEGYHEVFVLVVEKGRPQGTVRMSLAPRQSVLRADDILQAVSGAGFTRAAAPQDSVSDRRPVLPPITVVIATRNRPHALRRCLESLQVSEAPESEIIVVDSASRELATGDVARSMNCRYIREETAGLQRARNRGLKEARHDIVAFMDDDAVADPNWPSAVAAAFHSTDTAVVTGLVLPAELYFWPQHQFEKYRGMSRGFQPRVFECSEMGAVAMLDLHKMGAGTNMAVRRSSLAQIGFLDPRFDSGARVNGRGEIDLFHRVLTAGRQIRYEPAALVWHHHRRCSRQLRLQVADYGRGEARFLLNQFFSGSTPRSAVLRYGFRHWLVKRLLRPLLRREQPASLILAEIWGASAGACSCWRLPRAQRVRA